VISFMTVPVYRVPGSSDRFTDDGRSTLADATAHFEVTITNS